MNLKYAFVMLSVLLLVPGLVSAVDFSIQSNPPLTGEVNEQYAYQVEVDNPDNYTLVYSVDGPSGMSINSSGYLSWMPTNSGDFDVNITVSNSTNSTNQFYTLQVSATPSQFDVEVLELGSASQSRDEVITSIYQIGNTGSFDIENVDVEVLNVASGYEFDILFPTNTISAKDSIDAQVSLTVPQNQDSGRVRLGQVRFTGESQNTVAPVTRDVYLTTENMLIIESIEVTVGSRRERLTSEGSIRREARFGDEIELVLRIRNDFNNLDIEDIEAELFSLDLDDADGQISTLRRLRPQRSSTDLRFDFVLDVDRIEIEDAPFELEIVLFGLDENNARHGETWILDLDIERQNRDVRFIRSNLNPQTVTCQNTFFSVETEIRNIGSRDLTNAMIQVSIPELNIQEFRRNLDMFTGDTARSTFSLNIPSDTPQGQYFVELYAHPTTSTTSWTDSEVLTLFVGTCPTTTPLEPSPPEESVVVIPADDQAPVVVGQPIAQTSSSSIFEDAQTYVIILAILVVLLFVALIVLLIKLM